MPTFKHPCPHCGKYINRDVAACPFCATPDPFAPARCPNCRTVIEDPSWAACPRCGQALATPKIEQFATTQPTPPPAPGGSPMPRPVPGPPPASQTPPQPQQSSVAKCTGCGAPLSPGARFCTVCGTLAG